MYTIAIIEDDIAVQLMYKMKLELEGFKVKTANNGKEGLHLAQSYKPEIILLDLRMPVMSGDEMLARLRQTDWGGSMRVIILTNISKNEAPSALRFLHVDRYIVKAHTTPGEVVKIIGEVMEASKVP